MQPSSFSPVIYPALEFLLEEDLWRLVELVGVNQ